MVCFVMDHKLKPGHQRFEHKSQDRLSAQKIDAPVRVPASINMAPYTTLALSSTVSPVNGAANGAGKAKVKIQPEEVLSQFS